MHKPAPRLASRWDWTVPQCLAQSPSRNPVELMVTIIRIMVTLIVIILNDDIFNHDDDGKLNGDNKRRT